MWFKFPDGSESISVEKQSFTSEFEDDENRHWFRAPDHFAPAILGLNLGYSALLPGERPDGTDLDDIAPQFPAGQQVGEQAVLIQSLGEDLRYANEAVQKLTTQLRQVESQAQLSAVRVADLEKENADLKIRLDNFESEQETRDALVKANKK